MVSLAPKYLISLLFAQLDLSKSEEILRKQILKIHGTRLYHINIWITGTTICSHLLGLTACFKYFLRATYRRDIDFDIIVYTLVFYGRFFYSYSRYKRYFSKEVTENPFRLNVRKYTLKKELSKEKNLEVEDDDNFCVICYQEYCEDESLAAFSCGNKHIFHLKCINRWIERCSKCPMCKKGLEIK